MWYFHICRGCRGRRTRDIHYCSKSPDGDLNITFWLNRPLTREKHMLTSHTIKIWRKYTCTYALSTCDLYILQEPRECLCIFLYSGEARVSFCVARKGCGANQEPVKFLSGPRVTLQKTWTTLCPAPGIRFRVLYMAKQKQPCLRVCLYRMSISVSDILNCISMSLFLMYFMKNNTLWKIFTLKMYCFIFWGSKKISWKCQHWWFCGQNCSSTRYRPHTRLFTYRDGQTFIWLFNNQTPLWKQNAFFRHLYLTVSR